MAVIHKPTGGTYPDTQTATTPPPTQAFPFSAVVAQEQVKKALLLNCIAPTLGGVLIAGEKGTAKSTLVRALASLLPHQKVITLPLNATEDRVLGSMDMEAAMQQGITTFQPGLLAEAHGHILYIDEVNLLSESLINTILDAAASGRCTIAREGIAHTYPAAFILIGSMNPEEGSLRPQVLDRFGFYVDVQGEADLRTRMLIMKNRLAYEHDAAGLMAAYAAEELALREKILDAQQRYKQVLLKDEVIKLIADICHQSFIAGHRGDLAFSKGVKAHAALNQRKHVTREDIEAVQALALAHRIRSPQNPPPADTPPPPQDQDEPSSQDEPSPQENNTANDQHDGTSEQNATGDIPAQNPGDDEEPSEDEATDNATTDEDFYDIGAFSLRDDIITTQKDRHFRTQGSGRRSKTRTHHKHGHYVKVKLPGKSIQDIAFDATIRTAAPFQTLRNKQGKAICIYREDIREKVREKRVGNTILFLLDASGSMGIQRRMSETKAAIFELLKESYKKRDTVGLMKFNQQQATLVLQPTRSLTLAHRALKELKTGGKTPLAEGLVQALQLMKAQQQKNPDILPVIILLSDGRANQRNKKTNALEEALQTAQKAAKENIRFIVIDTETGFVRLGLAAKLANALAAEYYELDALKQIRDIINA